MSRTALTIALIVALLIQHAVFAEDNSVVLVTGTNCGMENISMLDVRKAYLGTGVSFEGQHIRAYRLVDDSRLSQVFFQSVVAMSEKTYERRQLRLLLKYARARPPELSSPEELAAAIVDSRCGIGYLWRVDAERFGTLKVLKVLWRDN